MPRSLSPIRVAPSGRYFETFDGEPFLFIGPNDAITWPGLMGLYRRKDLAGVEAYLANLAENGVTVIRLMLEYCQTDSRFFERPAGKFNPGMVRVWDDLFTRFEQAGIRVLLAPWDNFWMARRWHRHPYNRNNGGPAEGPHSFFTDEETIAATINRFRFIVERWGGSGVLAAWDLFNEIHPYWGGSVEQQSSVITRLSESIREAETATWGFTRPQTVSIFGPEPEPEYEDLIFRHPSLDFATTHIYRGAIDYPEETRQPAQTMATYVRHALARIPKGRPFLDTEHGPIHLFNDHRKFHPEPFDDEYERRLMWAHLASGGAGSGMRWPARHPHILTQGMLKALKGLRDFSRLIDWRTFSPEDASAQVRVCDWEGDVYACADKDQAIVAAWSDHSANASGCITLSGLHGGSYHVTMWDVVQGRKLGEMDISVSEEQLEVPRRTGASDMALAIRKNPARKLT
jgi:mannan endo-1,4-beta-mannosidase